MSTLHGQKGATTEKSFHFSRPRGSSKMLCVIKWCVDATLGLLTEMSWQEYLNMYEGRNSFQPRAYGIVVIYGSWNLLGTSFSVQVSYIQMEFLSYTQNEFSNLYDIIVHIDSMSSYTTEYFLKQSYLAKSTCICKPSPGKLCKTIGKQPNLYQNAGIIAQTVWASIGICRNDITEYLSNKPVNSCVEIVRISCHRFIYSKSNLSWKIVEVRYDFFNQLTCAHKNIMSAVKMSSYLTSWQMKSKRTEINQKRTLICMYLSCPLVKQKKM